MIPELKLTQDLFRLAMAFDSTTKVIEKRIEVIVRYDETPSVRMRSIGKRWRVMLVSSRC